jgi:hypothetical protein
MSVPHPSRRRSVIALALLAFVVLAMAAVAWTNRTSGGGEVQPTPQPSPTEEAFDADPTLLVQLRNDRFQNVGNVIVAVRPEDSGAQMYLPSDIVLRTVGNGQQTLSDTGVSPIQEAPELVTAQTAVRVDGALVLDRLAFAGFVDAVGGVTVEIPETIAFVDRFGATPAVLPAGSQALDGPEAALYATYNRPTTAVPQLVRFQQVWDALLPKLPEDPDRMRAILGSLGALARSTKSIGPLGEFLADAGQAARGSAWQSATVQVRPGAVGPLPLSYIDPAPAYALVQTLFGPAVVQPQAPPVRVRVYAAGAEVAEVSVLTGAPPPGVQFVWSGPTAALTASRVVVVDDRYLAAGRQVAAAAGLVPAVVEVDPAATPGAPITVFFAGPQVLERPDELTPSPDVGS